MKVQWFERTNLGYFGRRFRTLWLVATTAPFDLDIVISSSWRFHRSLRFLKKLFPVTLRKRIVDTTRDPFPGTHARWNAIRAYLREHPASSWRALK